MPDLDIHTFALGDWMTNCYVVTGGTRRCWIIDAGYDPDPLIAFIRDANLEPEQVLLTHAHVDHIAGLSALRATWPDLPIRIHEAERSFLAEPALNLSIMLAEPVVAPEPTGVLRHGDALELDGHRFEVRHTPGHSPGGCTFYCADQQVAIAGDALFAGSIGRTDFPTADHATLIRSIREQLLTLPDATRVLSGHGPPTTVGAERRGNPFL